MPLVRVFPQENPLCQRVSCDHPLKGARREGHFDMGMGPCKAPGCSCPSFQYTDPTLLLEMRRSRTGTVLPRPAHGLRAIDLPPPTYAPAQSPYASLPPAAAPVADTARREPSAQQ